MNHLTLSERAMGADGDDELMDRFQRAGDCAAFDRVFMRHRDMLLQFLLRLTGNLAAAEDASQHTWLKVIEVARKGKYEVRRDAAFRTWLFTLARNHVIDEHQRKFAATKTVALTDQLRDEIFNDSANLPGSAAVIDPAHETLQLQLTERLRAALLELPFEQREVIALWAMGVDPLSIASIVGAPRDTVMSRKKYAIAKLRHYLSDLLAVTQP